MAPAGNGAGGVCVVCFGGAQPAAANARSHRCRCWPAHSHRHCKEVLTARRRAFWRCAQSGHPAEAAVVEPACVQAIGGAGDKELNMACSVRGGQAWRGIRR